MKGKQRKERKGRCYKKRKEPELRKQEKRKGHGLRMREIRVTKETKEQRKNERREKEGCLYAVHFPVCLSPLPLSVG
jgi:hypothetical protein